MRSIVAALIALTLASSSFAQDVAEPRSGVKFPMKTPDDDMSLLGVGLRTVSLLKVKVFAIGFYVSDEALRGPLAAHKGRPDTPAFYRDLVWGDFEKQVTLKYLHDASAAQVRNALRERMVAADKSRVEAFVGYFGDIKAGQVNVYRWIPGGVLDVTVAGESKPPIADKAFAAAVFGIYLGEKPVQEDMKRDLVSRAAELIR